jgi:multicomponent Na+:H+ antiporter subunit A
MPLLTIAVVSGIVGGLIAPALARRPGGTWLPAVLPAVLFLGFLAMLPTVVADGPIDERIPWVPSLGVELRWRLDGLGLLFALLITGLGALIVAYASGYLAGHRHLGRFQGLLLGFMAAMLILVLADDLIVVFVGWGLTSFTSYLLIAFEGEQPAARAGARQALVITVAGELAMLAGFLLLASVGGTFAISELVGQGEAIRADPLYPAILVLVLLGAFTKSAQFPFHFWLPNAMAAPTPASAYLHSATMVKAGVYLLARVAPILGGTVAWGVALGVAGAATMLVGAILALRALEMKRVLAYSTVGALGTMVFLLASGEPLPTVGAFVFLLGHALYKGALFLVAGSLDHETGVKKVDRLAGLGRVMPWTAGAAILAALSMAGLLPLVGFIGKELVIDAALEGGDPIGSGLLVIAMSSAAFVAVAGIVAIRPFLGRRVRVETDAAATDPHAAHPHDPPARMWAGPLLLGLIGLALGLLPEPWLGGLSRSAAAATIAQPVDKQLALWHGLNLTLAVSFLVVAAGAAIYVAREPIRRGVAAIDVGARFGPERGVEWGLVGIQRFAEATTRVMQDGHMRHYLIVTILTAITLVGIALVRPGTLEWYPGDGGFRAVELIVAVVIAAAAIIAIRARTRLEAIAGLGIVGYGVALIYLLFGAPDLALTQVLIETLTVIIFVLVFFHLPQFSSLSPARTRIRDALVAVAAGTVMSALVFATFTDQTDATIADELLRLSVPVGEGRNVVNVILVDTRALDTFGEILVVGVAGLGVYALLRRERRDRRERPVVPEVEP